jgi:hypothetical protein
VSLVRVEVGWSPQGARARRFARGDEAGLVGDHDELDAAHATLYTWPHDLRPERQFRKIIGYRDLATLVIAIERDHDRRRDAEPAHTPTEEAAIALAS